MARAEQATGPTPTPAWLHGPGSDLLLGAGLVYLPVLAALASSGAALEALLPITLMPLLMAVLNAPHLGATLLRVYERSEDRIRYGFFAVHATLAIAALFLLGLYLPPLGSLLLTLYLSVVPWHFTGQNYGIALIFLQRHGVAVDAGLKRWLYASFVLSYALTLLGLHGPGLASVTPVDPSGTVYRFVSLGIPGPVHEVGMLALGVAYAWALFEVGARLAARAALRALLPALAVIASQALWFAVPVLGQLFAGGSWLGPLTPDRYAYTALWISLAHAVQYLWITTYYAARQTPPQSAPRFLSRALLAGSAVYGLPALLLAPGVLGRVPWDAGLLAMLAGALNLHHVLLDGAIWKLRSGPIARILIRGDSGEPSPAAGRAGARSWLAAAVFASGALGLALTLLGTLEFETGFRRASARADLPRLELAARRLTWLGRDSPQLRARIGTLRAESGDAQGAQAALERSLALQPTPYAYVDLGVLRERLGERSLALAAFEAALALDPAFAPALHYAGRASLEAGRPERARELLERAAQAAPGEPGILRDLARARAGAAAAPEAALAR